MEQAVLPHSRDLIQMGLLGIVVIVLGLFVIRPLLSQKPQDEGGQIDEQPTDAVGLLTVLVEENPDDAAAVLDAWLEGDTVRVA